MSRNIIYLGEFTMSVDDETAELCERLKEKAKQLAKKSNCSVSHILRPLMKSKLELMELELDEKLDQQTTNPDDELDPNEEYYHY